MLPPAASIGGTHRHNNFDLLRLLAALLVIFSHSFLLAERSQAHEPLYAVTGGQTVLGVVGVFVFFTISGYLITQSFETTASPLVFLAKRGLRIFPGLIACLVVSALALGPAVTTLPAVEYFGRAEPYLYVLRNALLDVDYNRLPGVAFGPDDLGGVVDGPLWSLPCEALMYLMVFVLGLVRRLTLSVGFALVGIGMLGLWFDTAAGTLGGALWLLGFFAAGICCYRLPRRWLDDGRLALLALAGLVLSIPLRGFLLAFPLLGGYLTIYLALNRRIPVVPAARFGDLSYGLYIYGWPIEQCVVHFAGPRTPWWAVFASAVAVTLPVAWLSWHCVESRFRWRSARPVGDSAILPGRTTG